VKIAMFGDTITKKKFLRGWGYREKVPQKEVWG
jgi:hypothetical protein